MSLFMPEHTTADLDQPKRNQLLSELIIEELNNVPESWSPIMIEEHLKSKVIDKFNINHPEYQATVSFDVTQTGTHITAWVTRRLALVRLTVNPKEESCNQSLSLYQKLLNWVKHMKRSMNLD